MTKTKTETEVLTDLIFGFGNAKLTKTIATFSLPAGFTCPFAKECMSKANKLTGKIVDGKHCRFRCFAASQECTYPSVRKARWKNFNYLLNCKSVEKMAKLIQQSLPYGINIVRIHVAGDYFTEKYFLAWLNVAFNNPLVTFYGYTKAIPYIIKYRKYFPNNFRLTASLGGTHDHLIKQYRLKYAKVVFSEAEADDLGLEIDHDDSHAIGDSGSFALLLHGIQPAGTEANTAWQLLKESGIGGYSKSKNHRQVILTRPVTLYINYSNGKIVLPQKQFKFRKLTR